MSDNKIACLRCCPPDLYCSGTFFKRKESEDFPSGPVVKNLPSSGGNTGLIPGQGTKLPHAMGQLSPGMLWRLSTAKRKRVESVLENSLEVRWLGFCTFTLRTWDSVPAWGTKIPQVTQHGQKKKLQLSTSGGKWICFSHSPSVFTQGFFFSIYFY